MTTFLGIYREAACSPGRHLENDTAILELVAAALEASGHKVALSSGHEAQRFVDGASVVFSMSRSPQVLKLMDAWARAGRTVVNQPAAVLATARRTLVGHTLGVSVPETHLVPTARGAKPSALPSAASEWWVKGGELYASRREDVRRVGTGEELEQVLQDFDRRGIATAVLQQHVHGRELKFYAVGREEFFYWLDTNQPETNGTAASPFQTAAFAAGGALALEVFGGDLVIQDDGRAMLIDLNDWPSFAPCRESAARAIVRYLETRALASCAIDSAGSAIPSVSASYSGPR
jgi:hypothetical protein